MGYQNHRISWFFVKVSTDEVRLCVVCSVPVEFDRLGDVLVWGVLGDESGVGLVERIVEGTQAEHDA